MAKRRDAIGADGPELRYETPQRSAAQLRIVHNAWSLLLRLNRDTIAMNKLLNITRFFGGRYRQFYTLTDT